MHRKARVDDIRLIHREINLLAADGKVLPRSLNDLYTHVRDLHVWIDDRIATIVGWSALHVMWEDLAEIRSLVVVESHRRRGIGRGLVEACFAEARELGLSRVFALTYETEFFRRVGFKTVDKQILPQKIWSDCLNCTKFPDCDETAMLIELDS